jgi:hypothetical protein
LHLFKIGSFSHSFPFSLSEYGCTDNRPREFEELSALMSSQMSAVYSGGLMYEYSTEANKFGIVEISGNNVEESDEYALFKSALAEYPAPTGDGGAATTTHSVACPSSDSVWNVNPTGIPEMPSQAQKYMDDGAGEGPGLNGDGSQQAGDSGTATASVTSGEASPTGSSSSDDGDKDGDNAGASLQAPLLVSGISVLFALFGTLLL